MTKFIQIPAAHLAGDDAALKRKREELKKKLLDGKKIPISPTGSVTQSSSGGGISIPAGKLAGNDDAVIAAKKQALKDKLESTRRKDIADALLKRKKLFVDSKGRVSTQNDGATPFTAVPSGVLGVNQWYEKDPSLLAAEKAAMAHSFPYFTLEKLDDGRLAWIGELNIGVMGDTSWNIMAVYNNNHPQQVMGSSVRIYLVDPDINELIESMGWQPTHLLRDSNNQLYLCTAEAGNIKTGKEVTSAASVIAWAVKWLMAFELVWTGDLPREKFNEHGGI